MSAYIERDQRTLAVIGVRIKLAREAAGLTQTRLAELLGVHDSTVIRWEHGGATCPPHRQGDVARVLGVPWATLFDPTNIDDGGAS